MMSFGLIGIISFIFIIYLTIKNGIKRRKEILAILIGISIILVHSLMDFDMSYLIMEMVVFMFIAIINKDDKFEKEVYTNIVETIIIIFMTIVCIGNILGLTAQTIKDDTGLIKSKIAPWVSAYQYKKIIYMDENQIDNDKKVEYLKKYIKNEPFNEQRIIYKIMVESDLTNEDEKFLLNTWKNISMERPYNITDLRKISEIKLELAKKTEDEELRKQIAELIISEYPNNSKIILDKIRNRQTELISKYEFQYYKDNYREAVKLLEK